MATDKELLEKADALLRRHALGTGNETGTYPVLTDLVVPPELATAADEAPAAEEAARPAVEEAAPGADDGLRDAITGRVLQQLHDRLGAELERAVAEKLAPQLRAAIAEALAGLEDRLAAIVAEAVARALEEPHVK